MKVLLVVSSLLSAFVAISAICDACLNGSCFTRTTFFKAHQLLEPIAIDRTTNTLYFNFINSQFDNLGGAYCIDEMKLSLLDSTYAIAVDQATRDVYMYRFDGLNKYNPAKNSTRRIVLLADTIDKLQFHQKLYYGKHYIEGLYTYEKGWSEEIPGLSNFLIEDFVIDNRNDVYFESDDIYRLKNGTKHPYRFAEQLHILATDINDNVYFYKPTSKVLYKLNYSNDKLIQFGAFNKDTIPKIVFDRNNNVICYDIVDRNIYYLTPNYGGCRVTTDVINGSIQVNIVENENS